MFGIRTQGIMTMTIVKHHFNGVGNAYVLVFKHKTEAPKICERINEGN